MRAWRLAAGALAGCALAACSVPSHTYDPTPDADSDADNGALAIVVNDFPAQVNELGNASFTVKLNRAPGAPVSIPLTAGGPCSVNPDYFDLSDATFETGQQVTITGLDDVDAADEDGTVDAAAPDLETRHLVTTIHDTDVLQFVTSAQGTLSVDENGAPVPFTVKLSAQPPGGVSVQVMSTAGAIVATPSTLSFDDLNWATPKTVMLTAPDDVNTASEDVNVVLHDNGATGVPDAIVPARAIDDDVLQILAVTSPNPLNLVEQGAQGTIDVTLNSQPPSGVTVNVTVTAGIQADTSAVTFNTSDWNMAHHVHISVPMDDDTVSGSATVTLSATVMGTPISRNVNVNFTDDDQPTIQTTGTSPLTVTEGQFIEFDVWLAFRPAGTVQVSVQALNPSLVSVMPTPLTFDNVGNNYATHQTVRITGTSDLDLASGQTTLRLSGAGAPNIDLTLNVNDDDMQTIVVPASAMLTEGTSTQINAHLGFIPAGTVMVTATSASSELVVSGSPLSWGPGDYMTNKPITVTAMADPDTVNDVTTVTFAGAGAPVSPTVSVTTTDNTVVTNFGYPPPAFTGSAAVGNGQLFAYKITIPLSTTLDRYGLIATAIGGDFRLALYTDSGNAPGALVNAMPARKSASTTGAVEQDVIDAPINAGTYWLVFRGSPTVNVGYSGASPTATLCQRNVNIPNLDDAWPDPFGAATCSAQGILNLYIVTYR